MHDHGERGMQQRLLTIVDEELCHFPDNPSYQRQPATGLTIGLYLDIWYVNVK